MTVILNVDWSDFSKKCYGVKYSTKTLSRNKFINKLFATSNIDNSIEKGNTWKLQSYCKQS